MLALFLAALATQVPSVAEEPRRQEDNNGFLGLHEADIGYHRGDFDLVLSGILDEETYLIRRVAPGMVFDTNDPLWNGRATLFMDTTIGKHLFLFAQGRADEGFDPHSHDALQLRLDEWFGRYSVDGESWSASVQLGKFATPLGNYVPRHTSMQNPLVRAPMVYDHITTVSDDAAPADNDDQINARDEIVARGQKETWVPILWGPSYGRGAMVFGSAGRFDVRVALTNATPCERPEQWEWHHESLVDMAWAARVGWNPFIGFKVGLNGATGPFYRNIALDTLPPGRHRSDYPQRLAGMDLEYSIGHLVLFGEAYASEWTAPNLSGHLRAFAYYVEAKFKVFPGFFVAGRWNQMLFSTMRTLAGDSVTWDRDAYRVELGVGYFIDVNLLVKAEYEFNVLRGPTDPKDDMASFSISMSF